ncbi:MAG: hypothetical protein M3N97_10870 [Pseudomonadota bacterium]|nr:hypothetical protein [Pseudomonadota bacterium]
MRNYLSVLSMTGVIGMGLLLSDEGAGQTPEQAQMWEVQRAQKLAAQQAVAEQLAREREARRTDPMAWVRTLDPMTSGGWEFRSVASDGSWADYSTTHQMKRAGHLVTVWLRQEYAEPQVSSGGGRYLSVVEKVQYDCGKDRARTLLVVYYADNNIQGNSQSEEADLKSLAWNAIVPGTRNEFNFLAACGSKK